MSRLAALLSLIGAALLMQGCLAYTVAETAVGAGVKVAGTAVGVTADVVGAGVDVATTSDDEREAKAAKRARAEERRRRFARAGKAIAPAPSSLRR